MASIAPDSTRSGSPAASRQRATANDGWWRTWTCTGGSLPRVNGPRHPPAAGVPPAAASHATRGGAAPGDGRDGSGGRGRGVGSGWPGGRCRPCRRRRSWCRPGPGNPRPGEAAALGAVGQLADPGRLERGLVRVDRAHGVDPGAGRRGRGQPVLVRRGRRGVDGPLEALEVGDRDRVPGRRDDGAGQERAAARGRRARSSRARARRTCSGTASSRTWRRRRPRPRRRRGPSRRFRPARASARTARPVAAAGAAVRPGPGTQSGGSVFTPSTVRARPEDGLNFSNFTVRARTLRRVTAARVLVVEDEPVLREASPPRWRPRGSSCWPPPTAGSWRPRWPGSVRTPPCSTSACPGRTGWRWPGSCASSARSRWCS